MSVNQYTASKLTSGNQNVVSLVNGFGYSGGGAPGVSKTYNFTLLDKQFTVLAWTVSAAISGAFTAGFVGPAWATGTFNDVLQVGNSPDGTLALGGQQPYSEAGFLFGAQLIFSFRFNISGWVGVRWVGGWRGHFENIWGNIASFSQQATIDLLSLLVKVIAAIVQANSKSPLAAILDKLQPASASANIANFKVKDSSSSNLAVAGRGTTLINPTLVVRVDLSQFIPTARAFNEAGRLISMALTFGPTLGVSFPINVAVQGIIVDSGVYGVTGSTTSGQTNNYTSSQTNLISGSKPGGIGTAGYRPSRAGFRYVWSWGIDLRVGVFADFTVAKVLSITPEFSFNLLGALGINTSIQSNITGDLTTGFGYSSVAAADLQSIEVLFEEPVFS